MRFSDFLLVSDPSDLNFIVGYTEEQNIRISVSDFFADNISGSGNPGYIAFFTSTGSIGNSQIFQDGANIVIGGVNAMGYRLAVGGGLYASNGAVINSTVLGSNTFKTIGEEGNSFIIPHDLDDSIFTPRTIIHAPAILTTQSATLGQVNTAISTLEGDIDILLDLKVDESSVGVPNGVASLDSGGKVPLSEIPDSIIGQVQYMGTWNAFTNTPTLNPLVPEEKGHYYVVSAAGVFGGVDYQIGDWIISNGVIWEKVDNTDAVTSVFGRIGAILALEGDYQAFYPRLSQAYDNPTWINTLAFTKITGVPSFLLENQTITLSGDVTGSGKTSIVSTISNNAVTDSKLRDSVGTSVIGRSASTTGDPADIQATTDGHVLLRSGGNLLFGLISSDSIESIDWSKITGTPTTLSGYGITNAYTKTESDNKFVPYTGASANVNLGSNNITANSFVKAGGTSSQFLKADGSVDTSHYVPTTRSVNAGTGLTGGGNLSSDITIAFDTTWGDNRYAYRTRQITINGVTFDLSADRTYNVGTVTSIGLSVPTGFSVSNSPILTSGTLALSFDTGYSLPTNASQITWDNAYNNSIVSASVTGAETKLLTLTQQDGGTITAYWSDFDTAPVTSVFGRLGAIVAQSGDYTTTLVTEGTNLYFTDSRARQSISLTTTGTSGPATYSNVTGVFNIPNYTTDLTGYVPYTGATQNVNLGEYGLTGGYLLLDTTPTGTPASQGTIYWDNSRSTAALIMNGTVQHIGQDTFFYVKNGTGSTIPKGTCVRFAGTEGASGHLLITPFLADGSFPSNYFMGVTSEEITNGSFGQVMQFGELEGINTSAFSAGQLLYASTTVAGGFQTTAPVAPNNIILVAATINSKNNGAIIIRPQLGSNINNDEGVKIVTPIIGQLLQLQSNGLWENKTLGQVIGGLSSQFIKGDGSLDSTSYVPFAREITINGINFDLSANRTYNVGTVTSVGLSVPVGFTVSNSPVTSAGNIALSFDSGYSLPTNSKQLEWDTAYANRIVSLTTTGTSGASTFVSNVLNIPQYQAQGNYITNLTGEVTANGPGSVSAIISNSAVIGKVLTGLSVTGSSILASDSILEAFGKLQGQVNGLVGGLQYQGTWNASTNTPTLTSGVGTEGYFYIVSVAGNTTIDGLSNWQVGDWIVFHSPSWQKVDNTESVTSVNGQVGAVNLSTTEIPEGTNLYFTDIRSRQSVSLTTSGSSGASTYSNVTGVFNIPQYSLSGLGGVPTSRTLTINGVSYDLSADRSWTVGDVRTDSSYANPSWITSLAWSKITGTPTTLSGYGITDAYTQAQVDSLLSGYVTLATDQTITSLKTILRGGDVLNFKIGTDTLYGLKVAYNQNELVPSGEATWSFVSTFNNGSGTGINTTPISFFRGVLVTGERLLSASINSNLLDYYGNNPSGRYPIYAYNTGVQQFSTGIIVGNTAGVVNAVTGAIADLPIGVVANFNGRVIGQSAANSNEFVTLSQLNGSLGAYLPLAGGTLTGALNGTSITLSGDYNSTSNSGSLLWTGSTNKVQLNANAGTLDFYTGTSSYTKQLSILPTGAATFSSSVTASSFVKTGGTSSQYLMADGSVTTGGVGSVDFNNLTNKTGGTGTYQTSGDFRAPIFYDSQDPSYYLDLNSTVSGVFRGSVGLNNTSPINSAWGNGSITTQLSIAGSAYGVINLRGDAVAPRTFSMGVGDERFYMCYDNTTSRHNLIIFSDGRAEFEVEVRSPIFTDKNNTGYYLNPEGFSNLGRAALYGNDNQLYINTVASGASGIFFQENGANRWELYHYQGKFRFYNYATASEELSLDNAGGFVTSRTSFRAPIFYDSNDTAYYIDGASTSDLNALKLNALFLDRNEGAARGISWYASSFTAWAQYMSPSGATGCGPTGNITAPSGTLVTSWALRSFIENVPNYGWTFESGSSGGQPSVVAEIRSSDGSAQFNGSVRSPIFYDSNNTEYYLDPYGSSILNEVTLQGNIYNYGWYRNYGQTGLYSQTYDNHFASYDTSYWRLASGSGLEVWSKGFGAIRGYLYTDGASFGLLNSSGQWAVRTFGGSETQLMYAGSWRGIASSSGFRVNGNLYTDVDYGYGLVGVYTSTRYQGVFAMGDAYKLPADGSSTGNLYGITWSHPNAGGIASNLNTHGALILENGAFLAALSGSIRSRDDMRAPIFYDFNNTGYYLDPASTSNLNQVNLQGFLRRNTSAAGYLEGNYPSSTDSNSSSAIYTIGGVYQPGSTNLGNMYGCGYTVGSGTSNPGLGSTGWGFYVASGGTSRIFLDSDTGYGISSNSWRAPIFYDSNDTNYYLNPNGLSYLYSLELAGGAYFRPRNWIQFDGGYGLYWPNNYGAHLYPNSSTYTQFRLDGQKGGYGGIWDSYSGVAGIMYDSGGNGGVYREASGRWYFYHYLPHNCMGIGTSTTSSGYGVYVVKGGYFDGRVDATIFYDANNTGYYVDPSGGSYLASSVEVANGYFLTSGAGGSIQITAASGSFGGYLRTSGHLVIDQSNAGYNVYVLDGNSVGVVKTAGSQSWAAFSDRTLKNIHSVMQNNLSKLENINPIYYSFNNFADDKNRIGLIAQEVQEHFPELVEVEPRTEKLTLDYTGLIPVLLGAIKELKTEIETLKTRL